MSITHGMDVDAIRLAARQIDSASDQLTGIARRTDALIRDSGTVWRGPDAGCFSTDWDALHRASALAAAAALTAAARTLRANADAQEHTSADSGGAVGSGSGIFANGSAASGADTKKGQVYETPKSIRGLIGQDWGGDVNREDGYRIQSGIGPDNKRYVIVSISGTGGDQVNGDLGVWDNIAAVVGRSPMADRIAADLAMFEDQEVNFLFVGESQGGMVAEELARSYSHDRNEAPLVLTYAAPRLAGSVGNTHVLRLENSNMVDAVFAVPGERITAASRALFSDRYTSAAGTEYSVVEKPSSQDIQGNSFHTDFGGAVAHNLSEHKDHKIYQGLADEFDSHTSAEARVLNTRFERFYGIEIDYDSDRKGLNDKGVVK